MTTGTAVLTVPEDLTKPSRAYRTRTWLAMAVLLLFVLLYLGLAGWFAWTAYRLAASVVQGGSASVLGVVACIPPAFFAVFMLKALFFIRRGDWTGSLEVTAAQQPELFAFIYEIADQTGAPRPNRVYLSPQVNACVFYDLTFLNLIVPTRKNLEIGLGLVNCMTLSEFRAVLAHEFGHFAQRTMAVGRWVYTAEQIAAHLIYKRDILDGFLRGVSRTDIRIAWIGWIMRLVVWSIRCVLESAFRVVVLAQRALSREMEFHADLVAVSVSGSDALINGLYRLQSADEDYDRAIDFANKEYRKKRRIPDIFAAQRRIAEHLSLILQKPDYGQLPAFDSPVAAEQRRIFKPSLALPPRMWSTHPPSTEREENAKRRYVPAALDDRSAWTVFVDAEKLREAVTDLLFQGVTDSDGVSTISVDESLEHLDAEFAKPQYAPHYRGAYLSRSVCRHTETAIGLYDGDFRPDDLRDALTRLYPESLSTELEELSALREEVAMLEGLQKNVLSSPEKTIRHRGRELTRSELPARIAEIKEQIAAAEAAVAQHDRDCRSLHLCIARKVGGGWDSYLVGLIHLLHYTEHSSANLADAHGHMSNLISVAFADGRVSSAELDTILVSARNLHGILRGIYEAADQVTLPASIAARLEVASWREFIGECTLPGPERANVNEWMQVIDNWCAGTDHALNRLRLEVLEELLNTEAKLVAWVDAPPLAEPAPAPGTAPSKYPSLCLGKERERQVKLGLWDRFVAADGLGPELLRLAVALAIVGSLVFLGSSIGKPTLSIYNGLSTTVQVHIGHQQETVRPSRIVTLELSGKDVHIETRTDDGRLIESFDAPVKPGFGHYVYNVAQAVPLYEWTAVFGDASSRPTTFLGAPRWHASSVDCVLTDPPDSISTSGSGGTRRVLSAPDDLSPYRALGALGDHDPMPLIYAHARWDSADSPAIVQWLAIAEDHPEFAAILAGRLADNPRDVPALRSELDSARGEAEEAAIRARHAQFAVQYPDEPALLYIATRAIEDDERQDQIYMDLIKRWPNDPWLIYSAAHVYAGSGDWTQAEASFANAISLLPPMHASAAMELWRIRRLLASQTGSAPDLAFLNKISALQTYLTIENTDPAAAASHNQEFQAYVALRQGDLTKADTLCRAAETPNNRLRICIAASDGASQPIVDSAFAIPVTDDLAPDLLFMMAALATWEQRDAKAYLSQLESTDKLLYKQYMLLTDALGQDAGGTPDLAPLMHSKVPEIQGLTYAAAVVMRPDSAPADWRRTAKALLLTTERPYFRD